MTEGIQLPPPDDPLDLAASAVVDGTATDAERALIEGSAEGRARVAAFRAVAAAVGSEPPRQDAATAEAALGAALGVTTQLQRRPGQRRPARWLAPAAAIAAAIVVALGVGSLVVNSDDDSTTSAERFAQPAPTTADAMSQLQRQAAPEAAADGATAAAGTGAAPSGPPGAIDGGELGAVNDPRGLAERASAAIDAETATPGATPAAGSPTSEVAACDRAARQRETSLGALRYRATATYAGTPALVLAYDVADGTTPPFVLEVLARTDCRRLTTLRF